MSEQENKSPAPESKSEASAAAATESAAAESAAAAAPETSSNQSNEVFEKAVESASAIPTVSDELADLEGLSDRINADDSTLGAAPDFSDFLAIKNNNQPEITSKEATKKPEVKSAESSAASDKSVVSNDKQQQTTVKRSDGKIVNKRDTSGFDENEQKLLGRMSNEAFDWVRPQLLEKKNLSKVLSDKDKEIAALKTGKQLLPPNYFEHPQAFVLTPEYNTAAGNMNIAGGILKHWQNQLVKIRQGQNWEDLDSVDGKLIKSAPKPADAVAEGQILSHINFASNQLSKYQSDVNAIQQSFSQRHNAAIGTFKIVNDRYFSNYDDDKHPYAPVVKNVINSIPEEFRNNPMAGIFAKAITSAIQNNTMREEAVKEIAKRDAKIKELEEALNNPSSNNRVRQPTESDIKAGASQKSNGNGNRDVTFDDFTKLRGGY